MNKGRKCEAELSLGHKNQDLGHYDRNEMTYETENDGFGYESSRNWSNFLPPKKATSMLVTDVGDEISW